MPASVKEKPELITSGPYAYIRHPIYTGILFALCGTILAELAIPAIAFFWIIGWILIFINFYYSAKKEEKNLTKEFPKQYLEYKKHTKMLIPFIY